MKAQAITRNRPHLGLTSNMDAWVRRVYVGLIVLLLPVLLGDGSPTAVSAACRRLGRHVMMSLGTTARGGMLL